MNKHYKNFILVPIICSLLFGCLGPPVGSLGFSIPPMFSDPSPDPIGAVLVAAFFSYVLGIIPALITGFISGLFIRFLYLPFFVLTSGFIGAFSSFVFVATWKNYDNIFAYNSFWTAMERMALPGLIGGLFCGLFAGILYRQVSNYAIKGTSV